jgi:hypothetical protein
MITIIPSKDGRSFEFFAKPRHTLSSSNKSSNNKFGSTKSNSYLKRVKHEHETTLRVSSRSFGFIVPLYVKVPKLGNGGHINRKEFAKCYDIWSKGLSPKRIKILGDVIVEVHKCFRPMHNENGYSY